MEGLPALWILKHKIKNEVGVPIDFEKRKFLWDIYNDLSPFQAILKPPQVGMTVCNTLKSLYVAKKLGRQIIYTLPTQGDVQDMVGGSFNRIIAQNPILMDWVKDHDTVEQKSVGDSMIFYRGTFTSKQAMMIPSGLNIHDEVDASDPNVIVQYENRLQAQEDGGMRWYFSHPSLSGHGVDVYWQQSDKKEWYITCPACKTEQYMTWPDNVDMERQIYICSECKKELPDSARINGEWQPTATGEFSGYHITQLMLYNKSAKDIIRAFRDPLKDQQHFYNFVLGLPYIGSDDKIEPAVVLRNCVDEVNSQEDRTVIGVDTGHDYISYVLMNKQGVFFYDTERGITASKTPFDVLRAHLRRFPKSIAVLDQGGELMNTRQLQAEFPGRVFLCYYNKDRKSIELVRWGDNEEYWKVSVDRNRMLTLMVEQLRDIGRIRLNGTRDEWAEFAEQFGYIYREKIANKETKDKDDRSLYGAEYVWKRNGPDHYVHALLYALVGMQRYGGEAAKIVGEGVFDSVPKGLTVQDQKVATFVNASEFRDTDRAWNG
jgi:DNA-directed RNA polymerase subunit RPC12/RpoP